MEELKDVAEGRWTAPNTESFYKVWTSLWMTIPLGLIFFFLGGGDDELHKFLLVAGIYAGIALTAKFAVPYLFSRPGNFWPRAFLTFVFFLGFALLGYCWYLGLILLALNLSAMFGAIRIRMRDSLRKNLPGIFGPPRNDF